MAYRDIQQMVVDLSEYIDSRISVMDNAAILAQRKIYAILLDECMKFDTNQGNYVPSQDLRRRVITIQNRIEEVFRGNGYRMPVSDFLRSFDEIQSKTINIHKVASDLQLPKKELSPAKQIIHDRALEGLTKAVAAEYVEPVKRLMANQVLRGQSIGDTVKLLEQWDSGELSSGKLTQGVRTPNLQRYATQISRDTAYSVQRTTNGIFKDKFGLNKLIYAGGLVKDSRPLCRHLVNLNRPIELDELPPLIQSMPEGLYPGTNKDNFPEYCGGYACMHVAMSI
jgi:hypothetical protein